MIIIYEGNTIDSEKHPKLAILESIRAAKNCGSKRSAWDWVDRAIAIDSELHTGFGIKEAAGTNPWPDWDAIDAKLTVNKNAAVGKGINSISIHQNK